MFRWSEDYCHALVRARHAPGFSEGKTHRLSLEAMDFCCRRVSGIAAMTSVFSFCRRTRLRVCSFQTTLPPRGITMRSAVVAILTVHTTSRHDNTGQAGRQPREASEKCKKWGHMPPSVRWRFLAHVLPRVGLEDDNSQSVDRM
jgi:hypothetical protein